MLPDPQGNPSPNVRLSGPDRPRTILGGILNFAIFIVVAASLSAPLVRLAEDRLQDGANLSFYLRQARETNIVFAGSSVVQNMIDPREFDAVLADAGFSARSFNIGRGGAFAHETNYLLRRILSPPSPDLQFVFIDFSPFDPVITAEDSPRLRNWHDLAETLSVCRHLILESTRTRAERQRLLVRHLRLMRDYYLPRGRFHEFRFPNTISPEWLATYRGYLPFHIVRRLDPNIELMQARLQGDIDQYEATVARRAREIAAPLDPLRRPPNARATQKQMDFIQRSNVVPIYLAAPSFLFDARDLRALQRDLEIPYVLFYDDPLRYPEFFDIQARIDTQHLNDANSTLYTRRVAHDFVRLLEADPALARRLQRSHP